MYSLADAISVKADWGHSSNVVGVELCQLARRAPVPVPPRARQRRPRDRQGARRRRASRRSRAPKLRCASPPPTTGWKSRFERGPGTRPAGVSHRSDTSCRCSADRRIHVRDRDLAAFRDSAPRSLVRCRSAHHAARGARDARDGGRIDAKSLAELGRWPWPRSLLADLLTRVSGTALRRSGWTS